MKPTRYAALFLVSALVLAAEPLDWAPNLTTTATWNTNATSANRSTDIIGALAFDAHLASSARFALGQDNALFAGAALTYEVWTRFDELDRAAIGPRLAWQHKFGLGAYAPVFRAELAGNAVAAGDPDRNARTGSATLAFRQRIDESTRVALAHELVRENAREAVYGRTGAETSLELVRDLEEYWSLALTAHWRQGDVLSYATPPRPELVALAKYRTENSTFGRSMVAYLIDARSLGGDLAATRTLGRGTSLALRYEWRQTERGPLRYVNQLVSASLARQF